MRPVISITLPTIYPAALPRTLDNIENATRCPYQVIVVSPFPVTRGVRGGTLCWIRDEAMTGCNAAHQAAARAAMGEFVTGWVDDHLYVDGWDAIALRDHERREAAFHALPGKSGKPFLLGLRHVWPTHVGTEFGMYYPYFPFARRSTVERVGWLTDEYRTGFADSDLAMRVWDAGGRCEWTSEGVIVVHDDDGRKNGAIFKPADLELFVRRWSPRYGRGWDTSHLRGFNNDVTPERFAEFVDDTGLSINYNDPRFKAVVGTGG